MRKLTGEGRKQGQIWEGLPGTNGAPALKAYRDPAGVWTIGWGHTAGVKLGDICTLTEAEAFLDADLEPTCAAVNANIGAELTDNQFAALVWFAFNVGITAFATSTLAKRLNQLPPAYDSVPSELAKWNLITINRDGNRTKVVSNGLVRRRALETALWLAPMAITSGVVSAPPGMAVPALATSQISQQSPDASKPTPPPTKAMQTTAGKGSAAAVVTGGTGVVLSAMSQAQPVLTAVNGIVNGFGSLKSLAIVVGAALAFVSIGCMVWVFMHKRKDLR